MRTKIVFLTMFILACSASVLAQKTPKGESLTVKLGETKTAKRSQIKANLVDILEDSRCPEDVDCIWAGRIRILVTLEMRKGKSISVELSSDQKPSVEFAGYTITLGMIGPDRKRENAIEKSDYSGSFTIEKLPGKPKK